MTSTRPIATDSAALLSVAQMQAADRAAVAAGISSLALMEAAGRAIAREIQKRWPRQHALILCGPGNNGGDGFVVARLLHQAGWPVRAALLGEVSALNGDAAVNARRWIEAGGAVASLDNALFDRRPLVVDALFGAGLTRGLGGAAAQAVARINADKLTCIAVDVPSGVHGDTGLIMPTAAAGPGVAAAGSAPQCALTVTFFRPKPAHLLYPGRGLCGQVVVADIGIPDSVLDGIQPQTWRNDPSLWTLPRPLAESHKHKRGHAVVFGGPDTGAARLAAEAARRAGAGLLTLAVPAAAAAVYAVAQPGAFVVACDAPNAIEGILADKRRNAVLIGPGFGVGAATCHTVLKLLGTDRAVVLDADALTSFAGDPSLLREALRARTAPTVLTPHEAEFNRLFPGAGSKLARTRLAASATGATVLFKGADTVVAAPDGRAVINTNAPPWLATAGSGDVLAGVILGLVAQGMAGWWAACAAAWLHGDAGQRLGQGLIAEDLPGAIANSIKSVLSEEVTEKI
ncbi:MAG: NAD(P)H-hydrate dehydratase [Rhodospirillaceae bacterium]|nr:NAD(P)H-hydrate dehydratase [Rhodospirillaceae bacterium]